MSKKKVKHKGRKLVLFLFILLLLGSGGYIYRFRQQMKEVYKWESEVSQVVEEYAISEHKDLVFSIIYTETKGTEKDLMQSSESKYGQEQQIGSSEESLDTGVAFLAEAIKQSEEAGCDIWTAVQAYNFGLKYIEYVEKNGKKNSLELAEKYSKDVLAPMLGNETEKKYHYWQPQAIVYNGGYLYHNGGNLFYADLVKLNLEKIKRLT